MFGQKLHNLAPHTDAKLPPNWLTLWTNEPGVGRIGL